MLGRIFAGIEKMDITFKGWITALLGIIFVRTFLENFTGQMSGTTMTTDIQTLVHFSLSYTVTILLLIVTLHFFTRKPIPLVGGVVLFGSLVIMLPPIVDFFATKGAGSPLSYLMGTPTELFYNFITFYNASPVPGVTLGMRVELVIILGLVFSYVRYAFNYTKQSFFTALASVFIIYIIIFIMLTFPNYLPGSKDFLWLVAIKESLLGQNFFHPMMKFTNFQQDFNMHFNGVISQAYFLMLVPLTMIIAYRWNRLKFIATIKNSRPERVFHYFLMISVGIFIAYHEGSPSRYLGTWLDVTTVIILYFSFYCAWMYSVGTNDIADIKTDEISNPNRPLTKKLLSVQDVRMTNSVFLSGAILGGFLAGHYALFSIASFLAAYYIYSCPPLQLKRFAFINSFTVAVASLTAVIAGFFTFNENKLIETFPTAWVVLIIITYTLFANIKDIKDIEGDKLAEVYTLPVIFGARNGKNIIWGLISIGLLCMPFIIHQPIFLIPGIIASVVLYFLVHRNPFREIYIFILYFFYIASFLLLYNFYI